MFLNDVLARGTDKLLAFGQPTNRLFWLYLLTSFALAVLAYLLFREKRDPAERPDNIQAGLLGYIFDPKVFFHKSAIQDYLYFVLNAFIYNGIISPILISQTFFFKLFLFGLVSAFGSPESPLFEVTPVTVVVYTVVAVLAVDFAGFFAHYLMHRFTVLWQFHQVHHSAEVLTPITVARMHPVDMFFTGLWMSSCGSLAIAIFVYLTGEAISDYRIMGVNVIVFGAFLVGYNLRHSHVWVNFPRWMSYVFISPAQHQIHHSVEVRHFDKNFGFVFSFWDRLFGSLYYPKRFEKLRFGINKREPNPFPTVLSLYLKPFHNAWEIIAPKDARMARRLGAAAWLAIGAVSYLGLYSVSTARGYTPPSVHLEDLTWTEVQRAVANGYTSVIIPTGGTEQNGPHMVLGKHNYIIRHAAGRIAGEMGGTLVAPVLGYVPEGNTGAEPTSHMRFPGTLSVTPDLFEAILGSAVESYATHGFKTIYLIGDSGPNQPPQARVAGRYAADSRGIAVHQIEDYYAANGQTEWLLEQGYTQDQIGSHAGIRDTSELLAVHPEGLRIDNPLMPLDGALGVGANGDRMMASAEIGRKMLELKIQAALRQMRMLGEASAKVEIPAVE